MKHSLFQLIDLDRTIFDTAAFAKALTDEIDRTEPGVGAELDARYEAAYANEETFFMLRYLRETRGDEWFEVLVERAVSKMGADALLLNGVQERLKFADTLTTIRPSWGVLTYGDEIDQLMKLRIIGMEDALVFLSSTPDKGELLRSWQNDDGTFQLPEEFGGGIVNQLTLEDDKIRAFKGLPDGVLGFWLMTGTHVAERHEAAKKEGIADAVIPVRDLADVTQKLRDIYLK